MQKTLNLVCLILLSFVASLPVSAGTYDAFTDFSTAANPNGVWSYGYTTTLGGTYSLLPTSSIERNQFSPPLYGWLWLADGTLGIYYNPLGTATNNHGAGGTSSVPAGYLVFEPGYYGEYAVLDWTAPSTGTWQLSGSFLGADTYVTTDVHGFENGVSFLNTELDGFGTTVSFNENFFLRAGDTINFAVGYGDNGNFYGDVTAFEARITPAPEPAAMITLAAGILLLAVARSRAKFLLVGSLALFVCLSASAGPIPAPSSTNLVFWVDGSSLSANGETWSDLSGNGHNAIASPGQAPTLSLNGINGQPAAEFAGSQLMTINSSLLSSQDFTIIAVATDTGTRSGTYLRDIISNWDSSTTISSIFIGTVGTVPSGRFTDDIGGLACCANSGVGVVPGPTKGFILTGQVDNGQGSLFINGTLAGSNNVSTRDESHNFIIGRQGAAAGEYWSGDVAEILIYSGELSDAQLSQNYSYLSQKYAIPTTAPEPSGLLLVGSGFLAVVRGVRSRVLA